MKLHLTATVPNEGARKVAQWVLGLRGGVTAAAKALDTTPERVQELVAGRFVPGVRMGRKLTPRCGACWKDFNRKPVGGWFDRPAPLARAA